MRTNKENELHFLSPDEFPLLSKIDSPSDVKNIPREMLRTLVKEVREFLVDSVSQTGGHLGAGLGTVELAVALHYIFDSPVDKLVWDTGHQAYPHKILTGRKERMQTLRKLNGLSGFLRRSESEHDIFGAGHASTAISAALGIATARDLSGKNFKVVAVVGDGSLTGGISYEAMNNAGLLRKDMIVILNDNQMNSLSAHNPHTWALHKYFNEILTHPTYNKFKSNVWDLTGKLDSFGDRLRTVAQKFEKGVKAVITPGMLFEALGFRYFGTFNGHNVIKLVEIFEHVKDFKGPLLIHIVTEKGKGYPPAEQEATRLHGVTPFDKVTGVSPKKNEIAPSYTKIFGQALVELAKQNNKVVGITAAMPDGTGLDQLQRELPDRFFDVGIAEQHAVTFAAGLATEGYIPVCAIYSTFLQRAFDQVIHDVALQNLHVVFVLDRAGLVGADGPTHHGVLDLSYLRCIQGIVVMAPKDENELRDMLFTAIEYKGGPIALRYPRGNGIGVPMKTTFDKIEVGKGEWLRKGTDVNILAIGTMVYPSLKAAEKLEAEGFSVGVVNMRFVKPLDMGLLQEALAFSPLIVTVEDNVIDGGFGCAVLEKIQEGKFIFPRIKLHGLPDEFIEHGSPEELYKSVKLDAGGIAEVVKQFVEEEKLNFAHVEI